MESVGYESSRLIVRAGAPTRLTFLRTTDKTCGTAASQSVSSFLTVMTFTGVDTSGAGDSSGAIGAA